MMNRKTLGPGMLRKRKLLMVLPVLVLPFITMGFWALGGGQGIGIRADAAGAEKGLNLQVPEARLKTDAGLTKMSFYEMAAADSNQLKARLRNDPYFSLSSSRLPDTGQSLYPDAYRNAIAADNVKGLNAGDNRRMQNPEASELKVYEKLKQINGALTNAGAAGDNNSAPNPNEGIHTSYQPSFTTSSDNKSMDGLGAMIQQMKQENLGADTEMNQINAMLEKVMDIQHPERVNEKYRQYNNGFKKSFFSVNAKNEADTGFYGPDNDDSSDYMGNAFQAVVSGRQTVVDASIIKLRLTEHVYINGMLIPKDNFVFGKVSLNGERLSVLVNSIRCRNAILPVAMSVFDMDGMEGIYIPGAITRDIAKQSTDNALQSLALNSLDPSIGAQAAGAGIETVKKLISKKVKLVRVTVRAGYRVLLRNAGYQ